jgi:hypothetical protein
MNSMVYPAVNPVSIMRSFLVGQVGRIYKLTIYLHVVSSIGMGRALTQYTMDKYNYYISSWYSEQ